ncbi:hypothetical protein GN956_G3937 [Arapaima gigas]
MDPLGRMTKSREKTPHSGKTSSVAGEEQRTEPEPVPPKRPVNAIPTGRQLPRTPPASERHQEAARRTPCRSSTVKQDTSVTNTEGVHVPKGGSSMQESDEPQCSELRKKMVRRPSTVSATSKCVQLEELSPECFIRGMQGYQWTAGDLEFVQQTKNQRQVQQLQAELKMLQKQLKDEQHQCNLCFAAGDKVQADLAETADFDQVIQQSRDFLSQKLGSAEVEVLDPKSIMSHIRLEDVEQATHKERSRAAILEEKLSRLQDLISNEEEEWHKEVEIWQKRIFEKQVLWLLISKTSGTTYASLNQMLQSVKVTTKSAAESLKESKQTKQEVEEQEGQVDMTKVLRRSKRIARRKENFLEREAVLNKIRSRK